jgi:hypothetical protein
MANVNPILYQRKVNINTACTPHKPHRTITPTVYVRHDLGSLTHVDPIQDPTPNGPGCGCIRVNSDLEIRAGFQKIYQVSARDQGICT